MGKKKDEEYIDGIKIVCKSYKHNYKAYKEIGGWVQVKVSKKKAKEIVDVIRLETSYYMRVGGTPHVVFTFARSKDRTGRKKVGQKEWAFGVGAKFKFPSGKLRPAKVPKLLPLHGVVTRATVTINGKTKSLISSAGSCPNTPEFVE